MTEGGQLQSYTIPPPVKGWTTKQAICAMDPFYSPELENWFPNGSTVDLRRGCRLHSSGVGTGNVGSLFEYVRSDGTAYLISIADNGDIYNSTASGAATSINGAVAFGTNEVYGVNFSDRVFLKSYEIADDINVWQAVGNFASAGFTIGGSAAAGVWRLTAYKNRIYASDFAGAAIYYGALDAINGAMSTFSITSLFKKGGSAWYIGSFSGSYITPQELFCIISERGEVLLYQGSYPNDPTWSLVGSFFIASPISRRSFFQWGNDILVITSEGLISINDVVGANAKGEYQVISDEINSAFTAALRDAATSTQLITGVHYPRGPYILCNIRREADGFTDQYVMNTQTHAWTKFTNQLAHCWATHNQKLYFGTSNGKVFIADYNTSATSTFDEDPDNTGQALTRTTVLRHAPNYFDDRANYKAVLQVQPIIEASNGLTVRTGVDMDYADDTTPSTKEYSDTSDTANKFYRPVIQAQGFGKATSVRIDDVNANGTMKLYATEVFYETGGPHK